MGYFFLSFDSIMTTNVAKPIAIINDSNTDMGITPFQKGMSRPSLSHLFNYSYSLIIAYIRSQLTNYYDVLLQWFLLKVNLMVPIPP